MDTANITPKTDDVSSPPLWHDAVSGMTVDIAMNKDGMVWVLHDRPFPDLVEWAEFDRHGHILTFITRGGKLQNLGIPIHPPMHDALVKAKGVYIMLVQDGEIRDMGLLPLVTRKDKFA